MHHKPDAYNRVIRVRRRHFQTFKEPPDVGVALSVNLSLLRSDPAAFDVVQAWARDGDKFFALDQWREICAYDRSLNRTLAMIRRHRPAVILAEPTGKGADLIEELRRRRHPVHAIIPEGSKLDRFRRVSNLIYSGKVLLKEDALWLESFIKGFKRIRLWPIDGQANTATQALEFLSNNPGLWKPRPRAVMACGLNSQYQYAPNGRFIEAKAWVERGSAPYRDES